jgi:hypothetical protein
VRKPVVDDVELVWRRRRTPLARERRGLPWHGPPRRRPRRTESEG